MCTLYCMDVVTCFLIKYSIQVFFSLCSCKNAEPTFVKNWATIDPFLSFSTPFSIEKGRGQCKSYSSQAIPKLSEWGCEKSSHLTYSWQRGYTVLLIDFIAKKKTKVVKNAQRQAAKKIVPISVSCDRKLGWWHVGLCSASVLVCYSWHTLLRFTMDLLWKKVKNSWYAIYIVNSW